MSYISALTESIYILKEQGLLQCFLGPSFNSNYKSQSFMLSMEVDVMVFMVLHEAATSVGVWEYVHVMVPPHNFLTMP